MIIAYGKLFSNVFGIWMVLRVIFVPVDFEAWFDDTCILLAVIYNKPMKI